MNSTEREIYDKYAYKKTHIYLVYEEFERRVNSTDSEYEGLKKGECRFDYSSWEKRLNLTHKVMINSIKMLVKEEYIEQRVRGKKGTQSTYFLTRFLEQNFEQNKEQNLEQKKDSNINALGEVKEQKEEQNLEQKKVQSSIYNNLNIKSNNIYSSLENELDTKEIEKDLIKKINSKYSKELIKEELEKLKDKDISKLDLLKELDKNLKSKSKDNSNQDIEEIWSLYPLKKGKASAIKKIPKLLKEYGKEQIVRCIERYVEEIKKDNKSKEFILHGSTFFNGRYMDYLDCNYQEDITTKSKEEPKLKNNTSNFDY